MKMTDKRFWNFEAMMLLCGFMLICGIDAKTNNNGKKRR